MKNALRVFTVTGLGGLPERSARHWFADPAAALRNLVLRISRLAARIGPGRLWWVFFALFLAVPAMSLALVGLRVARMEQSERAREFETERIRVANIVDASLAAALAAIESDLPAALGSSGILPEYTIIDVDPSGHTTLPREKLYLDDSALPAESDSKLGTGASDIVERALAAEARHQPDVAVPLYDKLIDTEPALRNWAQLARAHALFRNGNIALIDYISQPGWSSVDAQTPRGIPFGILAAERVEDVTPAVRRLFFPLIRGALNRLRGGEWWLRLEARSLYDEELRRLLGPAKEVPVVPEDPRLRNWRDLGDVLRRVVPTLRPGVTRQYERTDAAGWLMVWTHSRQQPDNWVGAAIHGPQLSTMLDSVVSPLLSGRQFRVSITQLNGDAVWHPFPREVRAEFTPAMTAVPGWQMRFSAAQRPARFGGAALLWYAFIGLLVIMLAGGVAGTIGISKREMQLAGLQAEFIAGVTHEFKSPITSIRLLVERLGRGRVGTAEAAAGYYDAIQRETGRLERLVNRVLESQRARSGHRNYTFAPASLVELAESSVGRLTPLAVAKGIAIDLQVQGDVPALEIDTVAVGEALDNLIDNAIKYSPPATEVQVTVSGCGTGACIEVRDQGIGVDASDLSKIFERFYRGRRAQRHGIHGTGLGLALVKATAEAHGGTIEALAQPDGGLTFHLTLPIGREIYDESSDH